MNSIPTRSPTRDGVRISAGNRRKCGARETRDLRYTEEVANRSREIQVEPDWTLSTLLELAQEYAAFWIADATLSGLTYTVAFPPGSRCYVQDVAAPIYRA